MNRDLYVKLLELRDSFKAVPQEGGRAAVVCSDAAVGEIARLEPKQKDELIFITGLGKAFVEKYGDSFMEILEHYHAKKQKLGILCPEVRQTLKNLENRLVNVNKRNRLLYMPKLSSNYSCDLVKSGKGADVDSYNDKLTQFIKKFEEKKRFMICDCTADGDEKNYKKLKGILRETNRSQRESGENTLYIAYPYVIGKMSGEDFCVRAPLMLFPVEVVCEPTSVLIKMDTTKDVLYNSSFILSFNKFNNVTTQLPNTTAEDIDSFRFIEQVIKFYEANGINIAASKKGITPFAEYTAATFPKFKSGELFIDECAVLGKFSMYSSALQKDFKDIIESDKINELLNDLLQRYEDIDFYSDSEEIGDKAISSPYIEKNINYINDLNISQETAIFSINTGNKLVVQGPPGTGKSQTITSMIADFVNKGKNVLMVSQKKAALEVIYSRLGKLSKYTAMINDVKNKDSFYEQLYKIFNANEEAHSQVSQWNSVSEGIDADLNRLDTLADKLYYNEKYGVEMCRIYEDDIKSSINHDDIELLNLFNKNIPSQLFDGGYLVIKSAAKTLENSAVLDNAKTFLELDRKYNWLDEMPQNLSQLQHANLINAAGEIVDAYVFFKNQKFIKKANAKKRYKKLVKHFVKDTFGKKSKPLLNLFLKSPEQLYNGLEQYPTFINCKAKFSLLKVLEQDIIASLYNMYLQRDGMTLAQFVPLMPKFAAYYYINEFEVENRAVLNVLDNYDIILRDIVAGLAKKKELSRGCLKAVMISQIQANILSSKRKGEMQRVIDGKRKWNVQRFVNKFAFELFKGIKVWLLTPEVVSEILPLETGLFDLLIFDEASQIYIEKGVPSIARAKKVVIAGDHKQLRPSSLGIGRLDYDEDFADEGEIGNAALEEESLLDLARFKYPEILLNYHYRSKYEELIAFSNYAFYKGRLNVSPNVDKPEKPPIQVHYTESGLWQERRNIAEADRTIKLIQQFFVERKNNETIGVITFNSNQRDLILDKLDELCSVNPSFAAYYRAEINRTENGEDVGLFIKNIENVQGDERDNIIFSLAYAKQDNGKVVRNFGWLNQAGGENRLNVAISRAKRKIDIVTSVKPSELKVDDLTNEGPRILKKYLEYAYFISDGNTEAAREVLRTFGGMTTDTIEHGEQFTTEVFESLLAEGFNVERNVGIGTYKVDIAIKNSDGKYVLGIECDTSLYAKSHLSRERDVHRRVYLEARGWKLYRVWSSNWWRGKKNELKKLRILTNS